MAELGIDSPTREYRGHDPLGAVLAENLARRHLDESQRALVAARLATLNRGPKTNVEISTNTQPEAARRLNVSRESVIAARKVLGIRFSRIPRKMGRRARDTVRL